MGLWEIVGVALLILVMLVGLGAVVLGLPGTWIILAAAAVYGWVGGFVAITSALLLGLLLIAAGAELVEFLAGLMGARRYGGSKRAMAATFVGGLAGAVVLAPFLFGLGSVAGAFLGAFAGGFFVTYLEHRKMDDALRVGWGGLLGRVFATVFKGAAAVAMIGMALWAVFSSHGA
ncbi:MAG: DUF456 domain-containing protein [Syntrophobacteria bacterium]